MTPAEVVRTADAVLMVPLVRGGWLDCARAVDLVVTRAGGVSPLGSMAFAYETPRQGLRIIRAAGGWDQAFAAVVEQNGYRRGAAKTGAIGYVTNAEQRFGFVCAVCAMPGCWLVPVLGGYTIIKDVKAAWLH